MRKQLAAEISIQRIVFMFKIGDPQIHEPIAVKISSLNPHASLVRAILIHRDASLMAELAQLAVGLAKVQKVIGFIVCNIKIDEPVGVDIGRNDTQAIASGDHSNLLAGVGERSVTLISKQAIIRRSISIGAADISLLLGIVTRPIQFR